MMAVDETAMWVDWGLGNGNEFIHRAYILTLQESTDAEVADFESGLEYHVVELSRLDLDVGWLNGLVRLMYGSE